MYNILQEAAQVVVSAVSDHDAAQKPHQLLEQAERLRELADMLTQQALDSVDYDAIGDPRR